MQTEIARLDELRLTTLERRIDADLEAGRNAELVGEIEALIAAHPLREHLRWQLILALYRAGRQAEALEVYRETRRVLTDELGLEPSPQLRELEKAILRQDPTIGPVPQSRPTPQPIQRVKRRGVLLALVALALTGLGVGAAFAFAGNTSSHRAAHATLSALTQNASVASTTATAKTTTTAAQTARHAQRQPRLGRGQRRASTKQTGTVVDSGAASTVARAHPATTSRRHASSPPPKPVTISDTFEGDYVDPTIWHEVKDGGDVSIAEQGGQLQLTVGADAIPGGKYNQIDVHVGTQCSFPGNFDARVDYTLLEWPVGDNIDIGLSAIYANAAVMRDSSSQSGEEYVSWVTLNSGSVALPDASGSLRIARINGIETTYFWHRGSWRKLASAAATGAAVFGLQAFSDGRNPFGGHELKVAFDNFKVTGINPFCS